MPNNRAILLCNGSPFSEAIYRMLQQVGDIDISRVAHDDPQMADEVRRAAPEAIVTTSMGEPVNHGSISMLLDDNPMSRVVVVRPEPGAH